MQKEVSHLLLNYLANNQTLALAGIGQFMRVYRPAHFIGNQLKAPGSVFYFEADQSLKENPPALYSAFAAEKLEEKDAFSALKKVFEEVNQELGRQNRFTYSGLGTFERAGARVEFTPDSLHFLDTFGYGLESVLVQAKSVELPKSEGPNPVSPAAVKSQSTNFWLKVAATVLLLMVANFAVLYFLEQHDQDNGLTQQAEIGPFDSLQFQPLPEKSVEDSEKNEKTALVDAQSKESSSENAQGQPTEARFSSSASQYIVIVGAFREAANAQKYIGDLKKMGYTGAEDAGTTTSGLHRVSVAKFSSQEMAEAYLEEIKHKLQADAWLMN